MLQKIDNCTTDESLITAIIKDDKDAFKELYLKYYALLIRFAWYRTYSMETSRDLVQDVFCKMWLVRNKLDPKKSIKAYLYKSVANAIINNHKLHSASNTTLENVSYETAIDESDQELKIDIKNSISKLPDKLRMVFTLSRYDGLNYQEISEICEISIKTVEKRMSNTFKILRKVFPKNYFE